MDWGWAMENDRELSAAEYWDLRNELDAAYGTIHRLEQELVHWKGRVDGLIPEVVKLRCFANRVVELVSVVDD